MRRHGHAGPCDTTGWHIVITSDAWAGQDRKAGQTRSRKMASKGYHAFETFGEVSSLCSRQQNSRTNFLPSHYTAQKETIKKQMVHRMLACTRCPLTDEVFGPGSVTMLGKEGRPKATVVALPLGRCGGSHTIYPPNKVPTTKKEEENCTRGRCQQFLGPASAMDDEATCCRPLFAGPHPMARRYAAIPLRPDVHHIWVSRISPIIWLALWSALTIWAASLRLTATCSDSARSWSKQSCL